MDWDIKQLDYAALRESLKGTQTEKNLQAALADEALARTRYSWYAKSAKANGYEQIESIFLETSLNEQAHAEIWFRILNAGNLDTKAALHSSVIFEHQEWADMYATFADEASKEGFTELAELFHGVARIERGHEQRYRELEQNITNNNVFKKEQAVVWVCGNCGNRIYDEKAPEHCPICSYSKGYFKIVCHNY